MERELEHLELLKLHFGDFSLHECDVMLRDVEESRHLDMDGIKHDILHATIISHVFWPLFYKGPERLHRHASGFCSSVLMSLSVCDARSITFAQAPQQCTDRVWQYVPAVESTSATAVDSVAGNCGSRALDWHCTWQVIHRISNLCIIDSLL